MSRRYAVSGQDMRLRKRILDNMRRGWKNQNPSYPDDVTDRVLAFFIITVVMLTVFAVTYLTIHR